MLRKTSKDFNRTDIANTMPALNKQILLKRFVALFVAMNVFFLLSTFRFREYTSTAIDWQILVKLALWFTGFGLGVLLYRKWAGKVLGIDNILLVVMLLQILAACLYAPQMTYALSCFFSLVSIFMILFLASSYLDEEEILYSVFLTITLICIISIIAYYTVPSFARMGEWVEGASERTPGNRLSGVTGNPNSMGLMAAFTLIIGIHYARKYASRNLVIYIACMLLNLTALLMSNSRTSLAAMLVSLTAAYFLNFTPHRILAASTLACLALSFFFLVDIDALMAILSRSGKAEEITSATGRTYIWEVAIRLIQERPLTGWGYTSTKEILPLHAHEIGHAPQSTHNLYLQMLFSMGIPGLTTFLAMFIMKFYYAMKFNDFFKVTILIFLLLHGLTESTIFVGMAGSTTIMFGLAYCLNYRREEPKAQNLPA